jgi:Haemolysin-III related
MATTHVFSKKEELVNAITHGIGVILSITALVFLIIRSVSDGTPWHVTTFIVYGVSMLLLYVCSTLVHSFPPGKAKDIFEIFDHAAIYVFIAGTYTPFTLIVINGALGWTLLGIVWGIALVGIVFKAFCKKISVPLNNTLRCHGLVDCHSLEPADYHDAVGRTAAIGHRWCNVHSRCYFLCLERFPFSPCNLARLCNSRIDCAFLFNNKLCITHHIVKG